jgi:hypothetical protein
MTNLIQRDSDKQYLISAEQNTWTADKNQATKFKVGPFYKAMIVLMKTMKPDDLIVL